MDRNPISTAKGRCRAENTVQLMEYDRECSACDGGLDLRSRPHRFHGIGIQKLSCAACKRNFSTPLELEQPSDIWSSCKAGSEHFQNESQNFRLRNNLYWLSTCPD
mmetsp:Transcript_139718/g.243283  ORF Transcript_139718/g.243283 Transcript_139718/m.243283 type:complete len:106 (-) Transcript_139718:915-1232(-)